MASNDDQAGSTTTTTGGTNGLRGLNYYAGAAGDASAFGTSGTAITNGIHTIATVGDTVAGLDRDTLTNMANALPGQYWSLPGTAWMMHPTTIKNLRELVTSTSGIPYFLEVGDEDGGAVVYMFGFPVVPNPYMQVAGAGNYPVYLAAWNRFVTIADNEEMSIKRLEQYAPGFVTLFAEKRTVSTIRNVFAGVRLYG